MSKNNDKEPAPIERWLAPVVAGSIVALVSTIIQLYLQPMVTLRTQMRLSHLEQKREAYLKAGDLVNRVWLAMEWQYGAIKVKPSIVAPNISEANECAMLLYLVSDDPSIPQMFTRLMNGLQTSNSIHVTDRYAFLNALRKDLYGESTSIITNYDALPYIFDPSTISQ